MNRKVLLTVLVLAAVLLATPYIGVVHAGKGQTKLYYEFFLQGVDLEDAVPKLTKSNILQVRDTGYQATFIAVKVGGTWYYPDPDSYSASMDLTLDLDTMHLMIRVHEAFAMPGGGIITQDCAEMVTNYGDFANMAGGGNFVGFGSGALKGAKIQGTTGFAVTTFGPGLDRVGTIMGWPE